MCCHLVRSIQRSKNFEKFQAELSSTLADFLSDTLYLKINLEHPQKKIYFTCLTKWSIDLPKPTQSSLHDSLIKNLGSVHVIINFFVRCIHLFISFVYGRPLLQACFKITKPKCLVYLPYRWIQKTKQKVLLASKISWAFWRIWELWRLSYKSRLQYDFGTVYHEYNILQRKIPLVLPCGEPTKFEEVSSWTVRSSIYLCDIVQEMLVAWPKATFFQWTTVAIKCLLETSDAQFKGL